MIKYYKGDLFSAAGPDTVLAHACNCKGSWGAGIALQFKKRYPDAFTRYHKMCKKYGDELLGLPIEYESNGQLMYFLFTSKGYGKNIDTEKQILTNTRNCVEGLLATFPTDIEIHSPKINAGLFKVPWSKTERIIEEELEKKPGLKWVVWEL